MKRKILYLNRAPVGTASTWHEVAKVLMPLLGRAISLREAQDLGSEGPDGFYVTWRR
jgi:hypothetical protein